MCDGSVKLLSKVHTGLYRVTRGRLGRTLPGVHGPMLLLTTRGRVSGDHHTVPLLYLRDAGRLADAESQYRQALDMRREIYGDAHANVANTRRWLGFVVLRQGRTEEANRIVAAAASSPAPAGSSGL